MPFAAVVFVLAGLASMGMPGFSGFPAELTILVGTWKTSPQWAVVAALGILIAAAFTLRVIQVAFFGAKPEMGQATDLATTTEPAAPLSNPSYAPISLPEKIGALLLVAATVLVGLNPDLLLNWINPALQSPYFQPVLQGGIR
jgi:NADH-quinone oxidoreductase subunit M